MSLSYADGQKFVRQVRPILERKDADPLVRCLNRHWSGNRLRHLLSCGHRDAAKVALLCLSLTGTMEDNAAVARLLHDDDAYTASLAEHALWSIWFHAGDERANAMLRRAVLLMSENQLDRAIALSTAIANRPPRFAEAYNQIALACFLKGDYIRGIVNCKKTLRLNPYHFGAMAGLGHCYAATAQLTKALEAYHDALQINPRMQGIRQTIQQARRCVRQQRSSSPPRSSLAM